ncbi:MAG: AAA family ATPase [Planctomycetota bacterium]|nr:AAA family ATPase [Planctomycetota bacterium]
MSDPKALERLSHKTGALRQELAKVVVGQNAVVEQLLISLLSRGHALLTGVPGLAKTLMVSSLARVLKLSFKRIQFTPDLMPSDITGTEVLQEDQTTRQRAFRFLHGPVFANILLADEINRTPPKTQAALLEAMQERKVTVAGTDHHLPKPFFVLATQNPIEQEGTYPLPEAQLDRFLLMIRVGYPTDAEEAEIMRRGQPDPSTLTPLMDQAELEELQELVRGIAVAETVLDFARRITRLSRPGTPEAADFVGRLVQWGAGPRASTSLIAAGRARAALLGRGHVTPEDIEEVAHPVLRHRILPSYNALGDGVDADALVTKLIQAAKTRLPVALAR